MPSVIVTKSVTAYHANRPKIVTETFSGGIDSRRGTIEKYALFSYVEGGMGKGGKR